jgi:hypothetical protein
VSEALGRNREGGSETQTVQMLERRVALLEQEVHSMTELRGDIVRLIEEVEFQKQLRPRN